MVKFVVDGLKPSFVAEMMVYQFLQYDLMSFESFLMIQMLVVHQHLDHQKALEAHQVILEELVHHHLGDEARLQAINNKFHHFLQRLRVTRIIPNMLVKQSMNHKQIVKTPMLKAPKFNNNNSTRYLTLTSFPVHPMTPNV
jgi:hypothetical protein